MPKMRAVDAIVQILEKEGATEAFGLPGAAINPLYSAMKDHGGIRHTLHRHVEGASHAADGYSRATGKIGLCLGTSGPAGTDMITGLYAAIADSIPMLCITGQAPTSVLHKEDFQAVDIESIAKPVTKYASTILEPGLVPGTFAKAFQIMRSSRPGPVLLDLPINVQMAEIDFDIDAYEPLPVDKPKATRGQAEKIVDLLLTGKKPLIIAGGGVINANASDKLVELAEELNIPVSPTLMGWGAIPDDHRLQAGMVGIQTHTKYGNATFLESDVVLGLGNRWANRHTGALDVYRAGRKFIHVDIEPTQIGRVFSPDLGITSDAAAAIDAILEVVRERKAAGALPDYSAWADSAAARKGTEHRKTNFDNIPIKPQRVYQEMNAAFDRDTTYVSTIGLSQIAGAQMLHVFGPRRWINAGQAGPLGWTGPAALGVVRGKPGKKVVALSGDYDFQFMIEELAVGAQFKLPYVHVVVNNSYLGLIRQSQRGFEMDYHVQLGFDNINSPETNGYGVDHVKVAEGLGCKAVRVEDPAKLADGFAEAQRLAEEFQVPVVVEVILEKVTNIAMGAALDAVNEFEDLALTAEDAPTALVPLGANVTVSA
ncbi:MULTISPECIES: glyoxylate carboligase [Glutamicibacter]|uniref:Glyoxylate carboligase n=1 Tax=Glutamicibacter halophytocola TaxID=1933880 RepID=A0A5B8I3L5_9MICC|nr:MULTISPECIES: glyoxylate carboligase [Glutamicibacter]ALG30438.1 glyoxylate carboligase [Glutamicibacter halophytocola]MBF6670378.1 glyoxylate carboligase [Glutamicibacter sp. FBE19]QDY66696.1 glyoxylate carboligase [Glutamicibacter halophytocola]UUX58817.1 glyoxylate carboligase [Glutamicibacter halophytocola]